MDCILLGVGLNQFRHRHRMVDLSHCGGESQSSYLLWAEVGVEVLSVAISNTYEDITGYKFGKISSGHDGFETIDIERHHSLVVIYKRA